MTVRSFFNETRSQLAWLTRSSKWPKGVIKGLFGAADGIDGLNNVRVFHGSAESLYQKTERQVRKNTDEWLLYIDRREPGSARLLIEKAKGNHEDVVHALTLKLVSNQLEKLSEPGPDS